MQDYNEKEGLIICNYYISLNDDFSIYFDSSDSGGRGTRNGVLNLGHVQEAQEDRNEDSFAV